MNSAENTLLGLRRKLNTFIAKRKHAASCVKEEKQRLEESHVHLQNVTIAQEHIQQLAQIVQQQSHKQIGKIVSRCLSTVFLDPYALQIQFVRLRGKTEAKLLYLKEGHEVDPLRTSGGVLNVSSLALRLCQLMLSEPQSRKLLILDEPFSGVDEENMPRVAALLETLAREMGLQIILVTHDTALQVGKIIRL